jgi:hypothetical protein
MNFDYLALYAQDEEYEGTAGAMPFTLSFKFLRDTTTKKLLHKPHLSVEHITVHATRILRGEGRSCPEGPCQNGAEGWEDLELHPEESSGLGEAGEGGGF